MSARNDWRIFVNKRKRGRTRAILMNTVEKASAKIGRP
jgi:hypothetical protein